MLTDIVRDDVVVPIDVPVGHDPLREIGHGDIRITAHAAIRDHTIVPVLATFDLVVDERVSGGHRKDVTDARVVIDREGFAGELIPVDFEVTAAAREVVFPRVAGEQHANTTVRIHAEDRDVGILIEAEIQPDPLATGINGRVAAVCPQLDSRAVNARIPRRGRGQDGQAEHR